MSEVSTWGPLPPTRPTPRRGGLPLRQRLRLRILGRRILALLAALALVGITHLRASLAPDGGNRPPTSEEHDPRSGPDGLDGGPPSPADGTVTEQGEVGPGAGWRGLDADQRALAIASPLAPLPLEVGDKIELVGVAADGQGGVLTELLTGPVEVLAVSTDAIVVAVPATAAPDIIELQAAGAIEILVVP
jgi:hypothetical protein